MSIEELKALLEAGHITQEQFDEMAKHIDTDKTDTDKDTNPDKDTDNTDDETLKRLRQSELDRALAKERKEKAELKRRLERIEKKYLSEEENRQNQFEEERKQFEEERKLFELEKRKTYAFKAMKKIGVDDGEETTLLIEKLVSACEDELDIDDTITLLKTIMEKQEKRTVDKIYKENGYTPKKASSLNGGVNPYSKEQFNFTEQMKLESSNPELAAQLKAAAGVK